MKYHLFFCLNVIVVINFTNVKASIFDWFTPDQTQADFFPLHDSPMYGQMPGNGFQFQRRSQPSVTRLTDAPLSDNEDSWFRQLERRLLSSPYDDVYNFEKPSQYNYYYNQKQTANPTNVQQFFPSLANPSSIPSRSPSEVCLSQYKDEPSMSQNLRNIQPQMKPWNSHLPWGYTPKINHPWDNGHDTHFPQYYQPRPTPSRAEIFVNGMTSGRYRPSQFEQTKSPYTQWMEKSQRYGTTGAATTSSDESSQSDESGGRRSFLFNKKTPETETSTVLSDTGSATEKSADSTMEPAADSPKKSRRHIALESSDFE